jgi:hypothetical protein
MLPVSTTSRYWLLATVLVGLWGAATGSIAEDKEPQGALPPKWPPEVLETFFPDARDQLQGERPDYAALAKREAGGTANAIGGSEAETAGGFRWSELVRPETLEDEIKRLNQQLTEGVATQTDFLGGGHRACRREFSWLAVLFAVVGEYDGRVRWHEAAPMYRDLFARAGFNCKAGSDQSFQEARLRTQDLESIIRGDRIEGVEGPRSSAWPQVADRSELMRRIETAHEDRLDKWLASPSEFRANLSEIRHESELLALLAEVISREGYEFWDEDEYGGYADQVRTNAMAIAGAATAEDFDRAREAAANISRACSDCHDGYR